MLDACQRHHARDDRHALVEPGCPDRVHPPGEGRQIEHRLREQEVGPGRDLLLEPEQIQLHRLLVRMGHRSDRQSRQIQALDELLELGGVDVVHAGRFGAHAQRLMVAAQAEDRADAKCGSAQSVALEGDAVAVPGHHGQDRFPAFAGQESRAGQGRAVDLVGIVGHDHRVKRRTAGWPRVS